MTGRPSELTYHFVPIVPAVSGRRMIHTYGAYFLPVGELIESVTDFKIINLHLNAVFPVLPWHIVPEPHTPNYKQIRLVLFLNGKERFRGILVLFRRAGHPSLWHRCLKIIVE